MIALNVLLLVVGFVLLIKGADYFVEGASRIAERFRIPQIVIGLTIVAFGTSAPEAAISIAAAAKDSAGIAVGNVLGSNIMNILLILGITACIRKLKVQANTVKVEMPFLILISVVLVVMGLLTEKLNFVSGLILWALLIAFFVYLIMQAKKGRSETEETPGEKKNIWLVILMTIGGLVAIVIGSDVTVDNASAIASFLGMSDRLIGLTIVAFGTSLPELITSTTAARKGNADIAIGNIIGSNIFNILFVLGTASLISEIPYSRDFLLDGIVSIAAAVFLLAATFRKKELNRPAGVIMLVAYAGYFAYLLAS
ncbi:MAG: calcium/sodium antiporter [Lachnospiraceae bacterium]